MGVPVELVAEVKGQQGSFNFYDPQTYAYTGRGVCVPLPLQENLLTIEGTILEPRQTCNSIQDRNPARTLRKIRERTSTTFGRAKVLFVYPGSSAAEAAIAVGDELTDANGQALSDNQRHDLLDQATGTTMRVSVRHEGRSGIVKFTVRDYLPKM